MRGPSLRSALKLAIVTLTALLVLAATAVAQQAPAASAEHEAEAGPVVRSIGTKDGYHTEITSETEGTISPGDRRQVALLAAQVFQHVDRARKALDADNLTEARREVEQGRTAVEAIRAILPKTTVHTKTIAPDGKVIYEDKRKVQEERIPLFEGMLHTRTLAPILEARRDASRIAGVQVVESEMVSTEVTADLTYVESQLSRAAKALNDEKPDEAGKVLFLAQAQGVDFQYDKQVEPLAQARDAIWLAKRALEEDNAVQSRANLAVARQQLEIYRQVLPETKRKDVNRMMTEVNELESKLRQESRQASASPAERTRQGNAVTQWWDQINRWFDRLDGSPD